MKVPSDETPQIPAAVTQENVEGPGTSDASEREVLLECKNIVKYYGHIEALRGVSFKLYKGEILGIVGDNGAGKSTLIKIIRGAIRPTAGEIIIQGRKKHFSSPMDAVKAGIQCVYQESALVEQMTVAENFFLGQEPTRRLFGFLRVLDTGLMCRETDTALRRIGFHMNVREKISNFSGGQRQAVAVARAVSFNPKIILLDEPTSALSEKAKSELFKLFQSLKHNHALIFVTHDLNDALDLCDRILILKLGQVVFEGPVDERLSREKLLSLM